MLLGCLVFPALNPGHCISLRGRQLQAGVRALDLRLAVNPWIAIQKRSAPVAGNQQMPGQQIGEVFKLLTSPIAVLGVIDMEAAGGPLSTDELMSSLVAAHSLPAAPLDEMLRDLKQFLAEHPSEVGQHVEPAHPRGVGPLLKLCMHFWIRMQPYLHLVSAATALWLFVL